MKKFIVIALLIALASVATPTKTDAAIPGAVACGGDGEAACLTQVSPFTKTQLIAQGYFTWCLNSRASNYPGFRAQMNATMGKFAETLGIDSYEVPYATNGSCHVRNDMPDVHKCNGCSAWIYTQNFPVVVEYKWQLQYVNWNSTIGHEFGHGVCLLDEHYDKAAFTSWILTKGYWQNGAPTVMDSGTPYLPEYAPLGIWYPTPYDVDRCAETLTPPGVQSYYGMWYEPDGRVFGYFCDTDDFRATRVAIMAVAPDGTSYWSGIHMPTSKGCQSFQILPGAGWCFEVNVENAFNWKRLRNDVRLGCT